MKQADGNIKKRNPGGRPRKFAEASRPVTVTLPVKTLEQLQMVDTDRARAIARSAEWVAKSAETNQPVEIVEVEEGRAIIVVGPSRSLRRIPFLRLVEIAPARFLLVVPTGTAIESLELAIVEVEDSLGPDEGYERSLLNEVRRYLTRQRQRNRVSKAELLLIDTGVEEPHAFS